MQNGLFPRNSRSAFETFTPLQDLGYIAEGDIEVGIKTIVFDNSREVNNTNSECLALKTNLTPDTISSFGWDKIASVFTVHTGGVSVFEFRNPTFFPTSLKQLSRAKFWIVNLSTHEAPDLAIGSPTFIEIVVKKQNLRMKAPFFILLDSSCKTSKTRFPYNGNMDFVIQLPKRMEFQRDWMLCLKSIHLTNEFFHIYDCWISIDDEKIALENGFMDSAHDLYLKLKRLLRGKLSFSPASDGVGIMLDPEILELKDTQEINVEISGNLQLILGIRVEGDIKMTRDSVIKASNKMNIHALLPSHFIVCCDLVESSLLGGQSVQILKYFPLDKNSHGQKMIDIDFNNNDYIKLESKNFDRIHIRILSITGEPVKCKADVATRMQLLFVNVNSQ